MALSTTLIIESTSHSSVIRPADGAETAAIDRLVSKIRIDSVMRPLSSSRGRNTSASVTVDVGAVHLIYSCI